jgi:hypothetical protein
MKKIKFIVMMVILLVTGCSSFPATRAKENATVLPTSTSTLVVATKTTMPATLTPTVTQTPLPLSPTFAPLMSHEQVVEKINALNRETRACALPCWWGIFPGKTTWNEVIPIFSGIVGDKSDGSKDTKTLSYSIGNNYFYYIDFFLKDGVIDSIDVYYYNTYLAFTLYDLMKAYGPPDSITIKTYQYPIGEIPQTPFFFLFTYDKGKTFVWYGVQGENNGENVIGCLKQTSDPEIYLWSTNPDNFYNNRVEDSYKYQPIDKVSSMNVEAFYRQVMAMEEQICVKTPAKDWQ